jgi:hypothetical protein
MNISTVDRLGVAEPAVKETGPAALPFSAETTKPRENLSALSREEQTHPLLRQAESIDAIFREVSSKLGEMKDALHGIIKNYPPYPPGSEERADRLENYNAFRRQIEQIRPSPLPGEPPEEGQPGTAALPVTRKIWDFVYDTLDRIGAAVSGDGSGDIWQVPLLPENASDDTIREVAGGLDRLSAEVQRKRSEMWLFLEPYALKDLYA